jgi:hypothetical protein
LRVGLVWLLGGKGELGTRVDYALCLIFDEMRWGLNVWGNSARNNHEVSDQAAHSSPKVFHDAFSVGIHEGYREIF